MKKQLLATPESGNKVKTLDFSGKTIFVGIDVHKKSWQIAAYYDGLTLGNFSSPPSAEGLVETLKTRYKGARLRCVYETCSWGFNLQRKLSAEGVECIVVHAGDVPGSDKEKRNKTDKIDAVRLARHHAAGLLQPIHVPSVEQQQHRDLLRYRKRLSSDLIRTKNRIKSLLKYEGIEIPAQFERSNWSKNFIEWLCKIGILNPALEMTLSLMVETLRFQRKMLLEAERKLRKLMQSDKYVAVSSKLMSVPGIGPITGSMVLLELGDITRFRNFDKLNSYVGFYPGSYSSGDRDINTGISRRRHSGLRSAFIEAAWQAVRRDPVMLEAYKNLTTRMKGNEAIVRIARKLLRRMHRVLLTNQSYEMGVVQ